MTKRLTRLRLEILKAGLTQREVGRRSGIDETLISRICNGRYVPDSVERIKIADAMQKNVAQLFENTNL